MAATWPQQTGASFLHNFQGRLVGAGRAGPERDLAHACWHAYGHGHADGRGRGQASGEAQASEEGGARAEARGQAQAEHLAEWGGGRMGLGR